jgi:Asp-tRNA(Asn)/Glu-tRNA(Gln) amidotransferase A subunit family amidase
MARTVTDMAKLLDVMAGYDPEDPLTALGVGHVPDSYTKFLDKDGLKGARIGVLRQSMGDGSEPDSEDFKNVTAIFDKAVAELKAAGATPIEIVIPNLNSALATRTSNPDDDSSIVYFARNPNSPYKSQKDMQANPEYSKVFSRRRGGGRSAANAGHPELSPQARYAQYVIARDRLAIDIRKIMADNRLDAIVHKSVEHTPTLIKDGINPPYVNQKGAPHLNTFLIDAASMAVPAGFTAEGLPVGITFFGPAFSEATLFKLAYAYEQATHHRVPPKTTPALGGVKSN